MVTGEVMEETHERQPDVVALVAQLSQLNERSRWYSSRLWQEPLSFFGIVALALGSFDKLQSDVLRGSMLIGLGALGLVLSWSLYHMKKPRRTAIEALIQIEQKLNLQKVTGHRRWISPPIMALVAIVSIALLAGGAAQFVAKWPKSCAQSSPGAVLLPSTDPTQTNLLKPVQ